jgi:hypothetical protein
MKLMKVLLTILILTISSFADKAQVEGFVERFYITVLDRASEQEGLDYWTDSLLSGREAGADIARGFIFSGEFINRNTTNEGYLNVLYRAFFNREPDALGFDSWILKLSEGYSRNSILDGFLFSEEFYNLCKEYNIEPVNASFRHYTNNGDDTVKDNLTSLIWQDSSYVTDENQKRTLSEGIDYCNNLALANYNDWRLPTSDELVQITDKSRYNPAIDTSIFKYTSPSVYWFDDIYNGANNAINFYDGDEVASADDTKFIRCVRGTLPTVNFTLSDSGDTVIDNNLNKEWQNNNAVGSSRAAWSDVTKYCEDLILDGKDDWRLPYINELYTIVDRNATTTYKSYSIFNTQNLGDGYWGKNSYQPDIAKSWVIYFREDIDTFIEWKSSNHYARCVRDIK